MSPRRVLVVGGGISGLAAAHRLHEHGIGVVLCEASARLGGVLSTEHADGFTMERGAESFLTDKPWALALCERIGIADQLIGTRPGERRTQVLHGGRLHALPDGFLLLAPTALWPLVTSPLFSWRGKARMLGDLVKRRRTGDDDESLGAFVRRRLGPEALERVADALVGGIYTADPDKLSLAATMPRFREMERRHGSIIRGLRAGKEAQPGSAGVRYGLFVTHRDGLGAMVDAIAARLPAEAIRTGAHVTRLVREGDGWTACIGDETIACDAVIVAVPAPVAADLLGPLDRELGTMLDAIPYASSATVTLGYRAADVEGKLPGFGFVVPHAERRPLLAATFTSRKFPHRAPEGFELVRGFVGGARRPDLAEMPDADLVTLVRQELRGILQITAQPVIVRVGRWIAAMPQYHLGHLERVERIGARVRQLPGVSLIGSAYRGVGIPDCVRAGEAAADALAGRG